MMTHATSKSPELTADDSAAGELCDVQIPHDRFAWIGVLVAATIGYAVLVGGVIRATLTSPGRTVPIVMGSAIGLGSIGLFFHRRRRISKDVQRIVSLHLDSPPAELIDRVCGTRGRPSVAFQLSYLARTLAETGRTDITIRNNGRKEVTALRPITVEFEAQPLSEEHTRFDDFDAHAASAPDLSPTTDTQALPSIPGAQPPRRISAATYRWIGISLPAACVMVFLVDYYLTGRGGWRLPFYACVFATCAIVLTLRTGWSFRRQWLVAPGGVILRESGFFRRNWRLHRFDRRQSVLIAHRVSRRYWVVFVADREMHRKATTTNSEAEFLLRAWLSPLHPPPLERLSDLV